MEISKEGLTVKNRKIDRQMDVSEWVIWHSLNLNSSLSSSFTRTKTIMSQQRRHPENNSDEDEAERRTSSSSDGLEFVPTLMKIKQIVLLRHSDFLRLLNEFNNTLELFTRDEPHYLQFTIVPQSNSTILWKALIRITCSKVNSRAFHLLAILSSSSQVCRADHSKSNEITLNLNQFLSVHQSLSQQISMLQKCPSSNLYNSASSSNNQNSSSFSSAKLFVRNNSNDDR